MVHPILRSADDINGDIETLDKLFRMSQEAHWDSMLAINAAAEKRFKLQMTGYVETIICVAIQIKTKLNRIDEENVFSKQQPGCGEGTADERMRTSVTHCLKQKLKERLSEFWALQERIHQENRELIQRHVHTVTGNWANEEAIDRVMEAGEIEYITGIGQVRGGQVLEIFAEIKERQEAVAELSKQISELAQVFLGMALYDKQQDEMLDNIERQVERGVAYAPPRR